MNRKLSALLCCTLTLALAGCQTPPEEPVLDQTVTVETENGPVNFELAAASFVKLCDDEDLF